MACVGDFLRDAGEHMGSGQRERCMHRVVERVDGVVGRAGMIRVPVEQLQGDRAAEDVAPLRVGGGTGCHQERQRIEGSRLLVFGVGRMEATHLLHVGAPPSNGVAVAEKERLDGRQEAFLAVGLRLLEPGFWGRAEAAKDRLGRLAVPLADQGMVVAERFTPVRHGEVGIEFLRRLELGACLLPSKAVQNGDALEEAILRWPGRRGGEGDGAEPSEFRRESGCRAEAQRC